jgi:AmmeMemoRadiSam system protein B
VAGLFYPADPVELRESVSSYLEQAPAPTLPKTPSAFIVPHAGYIYSGSTAGVAYRALAGRPHAPRVVLIGPSHRVYLEGLATPTVDTFVTPLGPVPLDRALRAELAAFSSVIEADEPHRLEHSLEVQLPFLQTLFGELTFLPLVAGEATAMDVAAVLDRLTQEGDIIILASSDLSHYLPYRDAQQVDAQTNEAIVKREPTLSANQACGAVPINGLLQLARMRGLAVQELARCNSGDTAGDRDRVVGYGAYAAYEA